ncbi:beta-1,3-galactosyltransferase 1-like [Acanthaster planci]|uniref:Hexosyltransferase n=1 Tax=Acanthaster planci TaxID=133434 RepID=A0A8B7Y4F8_ACAPL|nr:beta-1,3-galactosyltransferase 1-like [Acanthaster planci]
MKFLKFYAALALLGAIACFILVRKVSPRDLNFRLGWYPTTSRRLSANGDGSPGNDIRVKEWLRNKTSEAIHSPHRKEPNPGVSATSKKNNERGIVAVKSTPLKISNPLPQANGKPVGRPVALKQTPQNAETVVTLPKTLNVGGGPRNNINPHDYRLLLDEPRACLDKAGTPKKVFLLVFVTSIHAHIEQRQAIRETWGSPREVRGKGIVTLFLFGYNGNANLQRQLEEESRKHHDVLQEDFQDAYRNLTLKTIMGMKWASTHCPQASYVMKTDDDMYISYDNLIKLLTNAATPSTNYAVGYLITGGTPFRDPANKWYMPREMYPKSSYPTFLSGTGYVVSGDVARKVYERSLQTKYLHLEDVYVAVCMEALNITPRGDANFHNWHLQYSFRNYCRLISSHWAPPQEMRRIWSEQQRRGPC